VFGVGVGGVDGADLEAWVGAEESFEVFELKLFIHDARLPDLPESCVTFSELFRVNRLGLCALLGVGTLE